MNCTPPDAEVEVREHPSPPCCRRIHQLVRLWDLARPDRWPDHPEAYAIHTAITKVLLRLLEASHDARN